MKEASKLLRSFLRKINSKFTIHLADNILQGLGFCVSGGFVRFCCQLFWAGQFGFFFAVFK